MTSLRARTRSPGFIAAGVIATVLLAGCAGSAKLSRASGQAERSLEKSQRSAEKSVASAERAVARNPQNPSLRAGLGVAYLQAGRFASAGTALDDAMRLGDNSPRTALSLALARIGSGRGREAVAILDDWRDTIPASDLGLALALAGESSRGVAILTDALRAGQNTAKLRQNLAYAYALDGRWREARTMMAQDVPADLIDQRVSEWAMQGKPEDFQKRVAALLGAPVRNDPGLPRNLALGETAPIEQVAAEATANPSPVAGTPTAALTELPASNQPAAPALATLAEMPAVAEAPAAAPAPIDAFATATPVEAPPALQQAPAVEPPASFASAFATSSGSTAVVQPVPADWQPVRAAPRSVRVALPAAKSAAPRNGSHLVQLGSFASPQGARRAWGILAARNPRLREYRMVITPAVVNGRNFWRVAAAGFDASGAVGMCASVRGRGGACFAYAATHAPAGAVPGKAEGVAGPRMARRR
jgi:tetratricopeptide (TPR) repeat protein